MFDNNDPTSGFREVEGSPDEEEDDNPFAVEEELILSQPSMADKSESEFESDESESNRASAPPRALSRGPDLFGVREKEADERSVHPHLQTSQVSNQKRMQSAPPTSSDIKGRSVENYPIYVSPTSRKPKARQLRLSVSAFNRPKPHPSPIRVEEIENLGEPSDFKPNSKPKSSSKVQPSPSTSKPKSEPKPKSKSQFKPSTTSTSTKRERNSCPLCNKMIEGDNAALNSHIDWCLSREAIKEASAG
jgi:hypothetical protein